MPQENLKNNTVDDALSLLDRYWAERGHFRYFIRVRTIDEALFLLDEHLEEATIKAGGVDLVSLMKNKIAAPKAIISINAIPELDYIEEDSEGLKIGALATIKDIETSAVTKDRYNILSEAAHSVGSPHIRNMSTIAGNLCQSVRCWYYRRSPVTGLSFFCRRKGGEQCYALDGDNRYHSIIGDRNCVAVCPSDMAPALIALEAKVKVATSSSGERTVPLEEFFTTMGNILKPNEMITEIQIPAPTHITRQQYLKFRLRKTIDFAISSAAVALSTDAGVITDSRIVLGGVAPTPYRARQAEEVLQGKELTGSIAEEAAKAALSEASPLSMNAHKVPITEALVKRAIQE
ncbi:FAD binding domain-containing protein [Chloroflexota bacterium]